MDVAQILQGLSYKVCVLSCYEIFSYLDYLF